MKGVRDEAWCQAGSRIAAKQPKNYDEAIALLCDLRDLNVRAGQQAEAAAVSTCFSKSTQ